MSESDENLVATIKHIRAAHQCSGGARLWFKSNGLDWNDFLKNGIPVKKLVELGCPLGLRVAEEARRGRK